MISLFELFKIGVGPSSSHTVGPMVAARRFASELEHATQGQAKVVSRICIELFGSLALTGLGHATDRAVLMGILGEHPETIDPTHVEARYEQILSEHQIAWNGVHSIPFELERDLLFHRNDCLPAHPNGMRFSAFASDSSTLVAREYYSVGGGFVIGEDGPISGGSGVTSAVADPKDPPFPFTSGEELLSICRSQKLTPAEVVHLNELASKSESEIAERLDRIWQTMRSSIDRGCSTGGILPGGLKIRRRAPELFRKLSSDLTERNVPDPLEHMDWVAMFALAVNEENAAGGRVVTAPTNGAAGVIPAVLAYYERFIPGAHRAGIHEFLKTAGAVGMLYKRNASLSAAEMGCQGEVGVACSMAAAGLAAVMGGTAEQIENAAEIGMEHNLGLTCDPVAGLVQIPCIERNTMGAVKAINAARLAVLYGDGDHRVSLDRVIETMRQTGVDMQTKYKETSLGGLAVNVINC